MRTETKPPIDNLPTVRVQNDRWERIQNYQQHTVEKDIKAVSEYQEAILQYQQFISQSANQPEEQGNDQSQRFISQDQPEDDDDQDQDETFRQSQQCVINGQHNDNESQQDQHADSGRDQHARLIGDMGLWQWILCLATGVTHLLHAFMTFGNRFQTYKTQYWCQREFAYINGSVDSWLNISAPMDHNGVYNRCYKFEMDYTASNLTRPSEDHPKILCDKWEFDDSDFQMTVVQRFNMVCSNDYFTRATQMAYFAGFILGVQICGPLSDWFGRKIGYLSLLVLLMVAGTGGYFISNPYVWLAVRVLCGAAAIGFTTVGRVYRLELTSGKWKSKSTHYFANVPWLVGRIIVVGLVYIIPNMMSYELLVGLLAVPTMIMWFTLPESPRWLLGTGRMKEAKEVYRGACKWNKVPLERVDLITIPAQSKSTSKAYIHHFFQYPAIRRNSIILCWCWFAISNGFYGLVFNTPSFDANIYLVFAIPPLLNLPLCFLLPYLENKIGRKPMFTGFLVFPGLFLMLLAFLPNGEGATKWLIIAVCWFVQLCSSSNMNVAYTFTQELYPTTHRTMAVSMASTCARIGALVSSAVAMLDVIHPILPLLTYGFFLLSAGILSIWIWPETKKTHLTNTLSEMETLAKSDNRWTKRVSKWLCCQK